MNQLNEIFNEIKDLPYIANKKSNGLCRHVSFLVQWQLFYQGFNPLTFKINLDKTAKAIGAPFQDKIDQSMILVRTKHEKPNVNLYDFHQAAGVYLNGKKIILDPLFQKPMDLKDWISGFQLCVLDNKIDYATEIIKSAQIEIKHVEITPADMEEQSEDLSVYILENDPWVTYQSNIQRIIDSEKAKMMAKPKMEMVR